jgi:molybdate-binding protein/transcriptional regulator with XRE-family HTH domain
VRALLDRILTIYDKIMSIGFTTSLRSAREARRWSQDELARRAKISRTEVSAIETGRTVPSTAVALRLARALGQTVESVFSVAGEGQEAEWAWAPNAASGRFWTAEVAGRTLRYPVEASARATLPHDGRIPAASARRGGARTANVARAPAAGEAGGTLVVAGCDPAVGILAEELRRRKVRLLPFVRSSRRALELLAARRVHVAGVHLTESTSENLAAARRAAGVELGAVHLTRWSEGVALAPGLRVASARAAVRARLRWVGRDEGSGARACMDALLDGRHPPQGFDRTASDHRGVVETIRTGWAQAGVCVEIAAEEGGLGFLSVRTATYDLCFLPETADDPRLEALLDAVRGSTFRRTLSDLPGYDPRDAGALA